MNADAQPQREPERTRAENGAGSVRRERIAARAWGGAAMFGRARGEGRGEARAEGRANFGTHRGPGRGRLRPLPLSPDLRVVTDLIGGRIDQLERRMMDQTAELRRAVDDLRALLDAAAGATLARIDAHEEYHRNNEHAWGLVKLAARRPFRLAGLVLAGSSALAALSPAALRALGKAFVGLFG